MPRSFEIRKEVSLAATPEEVWDAIATSSGLATWFMPMPVSADGPGVVDWQPGRRLLIKPPPNPDGSAQAFEYLIDPTGDHACVLRFVHSGFLSDDWADEYEPMTGHGWDMYLHTLSQYFRLFRGRSATYVEAEGPSNSSEPDAWPRLTAALGGGGEGRGRVRINLPGLDSMDGEIDYQTSRFVGVRTTDALIRFHDRSTLGMTAAVSHHCYDKIAPEVATTAWRGWLAGVFATD